MDGVLKNTQRTRSFLGPKEHCPEPNAPVSKRMFAEFVKPAASVPRKQRFVEYLDIETAESDIGMIENVPSLPVTLRDSCSASP